MFDESKALAKLYFCVVNAGGVAERFLTNSNKVTTWGCGLETRFFICCEVYVVASCQIS